MSMLIPKLEELVQENKKKMYIIYKIWEILLV
ncbi:hypothetical protein N3C_1529 [Clostridium sp. N3C]|nr:hypothetical protein N3C_1529 [Clostridium sp. N3C]